MGRDRRVVTTSAKQTRALGAELAKTAPPNAVFCLFGELGAGKTTFVKGVVEGVTAVGAEQVVSPTFVYLNQYESVYHFDLYRLTDSDEFVSLGFEDYFYAGGICCIEWSERITSLLPERALFIKLSHLTEESREIQISERPIFEDSCKV